MRQPDHHTHGGSNAPRVSRRAFLALVGVAAAGAAVIAVSNAPATPSGTWSPVPPTMPGAPPANGASELTLAQFMQVSRVLTAFDDLNDEVRGATYLAALNAQQYQATLALLWVRGGFAAAAPDSVVDLMAAGVYDDPELASLADTVTGYWYSGIYDSAPDTQQVATYTQALAWLTLGYRAAGPSTCTGVFGSWASAPSPVI